MPDEPITDLAYIEQTSKANEQENQAFRAYVKGDLELSDYRLHGLVRQTTDNSPAPFSRTTCAPSMMSGPPCAPAIPICIATSVIDSGKPSIMPKPAPSSLTCWNA
jgi:hypothetical protein